MTYIPDTVENKDIRELLLRKIIEEEPEEWKKHQETKRKDKQMDEFRKQVYAKINDHKSQGAVECVRCAELYYPVKNPLDVSQPETKKQIDAILRGKRAGILISTAT